MYSVFIQLQLTAPLYSLQNLLSPSNTCFDLQVFKCRSETVVKAMMEVIPNEPFWISQVRIWYSCHFWQNCLMYPFGNKFGSCWAPCMSNLSEWNRDSSSITPINQFERSRFDWSITSTNQPPYCDWWDKEENLKSRKCWTDKQMDWLSQAQAPLEYW